jgi:hypothetical protein
MPIPAQNPQATPGGPGDPGLLIVARDQGDLYDALRHAYADTKALTVLVDRRQAERRRECQTVPGERRRGERRSLPTLAHDLRFQQYLLVRPPRRRSPA